MATGGGDNEKNVQEKKKEPNKGREEEDFERFLEMPWERFRRGLRSSWGPFAKESY
jgi:hypothetical protein